MMKGKKCPSCGKKVAPKASYCIYCAARFDDQAVKEASDLEDIYSLASELCDIEETVSLDTVLSEDATDITQEMDLSEADLPVDESTALVNNELTDDQNSSKKQRSNGKFWLVLSIIGFSLIVIAVVLYVIKWGGKVANEPAQDVVQDTQTKPTISAERQAWLDTFKGQWVDEHSVGKKDLLTQGGQSLVITDITNDIVTFDLYSHSGGANNETALLNGVQAVLYNDTLHFTFENDALQHSGEGYMQVHDGGINVEVLIKNINPDEHSLSMNTVFVRQSLPHSEGADIRALHDTAALSVLGDAIAEAIPDEEGTLYTQEYTYGFVTMDSEQVVRSILIEFDRLEDKGALCYECFDGTATYDAVKTYYGEAEQDYEELDTKIFLLHYPLSETSSVTFTFDSESKIIKSVKYIKTIVDIS